jgi:hypothetical protein
VSEAVGPVRGDFRIEHWPSGALFDRVNCCAGKSEPRAQLIRRRGDVDKFLQQFVENLHPIASVVFNSTAFKKFSRGAGYMRP